jgi:hypothetical protein
MRINFEWIFIVLISFCLAFSGCTGIQVATPTLTATLPPTAIPIPTVTPIPLPRLSLVPGEFYFHLDDQPSFIFSRNLGANQEFYYGPFLEWSSDGGSRIVRVLLSVLGAGFTVNGDVDEVWARQWERIFDHAEMEGIYILPILNGQDLWDTNNPEMGWLSNPFNAANGGPTQDPLDLYQAGSETQELWLGWMEKLVERWHGRTNILAWEILGEVNCSPAAEADGIALINRAVSRIRAIDPGRLLTASRCESGSWPDFYAQADIDFVQVHPYPVTGQLDRNILYLVRQVLTTYHLPVMIGESGLHFVRPDFEEGKMTVAENAKRGVRHAIWAGIVSGAMNGRALWWEDSIGIYFPELGMPWLEQYSTMELPAVHFVQDVDFAGFTPLTSTSSPAVWGAAVGNESMVLGWFRDAASEPPDWTVQTIPAGQTVAITVPGTNANWQVDFYDTKTGTDLVSSSTVTRKGNKVTITLPDFTDDIAFKITAQAGTSTITPTTEAIPVTPTVVLNPDAISGTWSGTISSSDGTFSTRLELSIQPACDLGKVCGTFSAPQLPCSGDLSLQEISGNTFIFIEQNATGASFCVSGGYEYLQLLPYGTLSYTYSFTPSSTDTTSGILRRP